MVENRNMDLQSEAMRIMDLESTNMHSLNNLFFRNEISNSKISWDCKSHRHERSKNAENSNKRITETCLCEPKVPKQDWKCRKSLLRRASRSSLLSE